MNLSKRDELHGLLKKFAEDIGATKQEDYILSQKVMGMGKSIQLKDRAIKKHLEEHNDDYSLEVYEELIAEFKGEK